MKYEFAIGMHRDADPQEIGEHLESLIEHYEERFGAEEILVDARKATSPLHPLFQWDESKAAEAHRRQQAKTLMRNLVVKKGGKKTRTRAFVYVHRPDEPNGKRVFLTVRSAMGRREIREQVIEQALASLNRWMNFYGRHSQLSAVQKDVARLRRKIETELMASL